MENKGKETSYRVEQKDKEIFLKKEDEEMKNRKKKGC